MSPSATFFDHTVQVWRPTVVRDDMTRRDERTYAKEGEVLDAGVQSDRRNLIVLAPGEAEVGRWNVYLPIEATAVLEADVVEVLAGPEAPRTLLVQEAYRPRGRFQQVKATNWEGALPDADD